jgi:transcriptional regulator GlxA family with amidase domain
MPRTTEPITVALLALPETTAATLYAFYDGLASVRRDWTMLHGRPPVPSPFRPLVVSEDGLPFTTGNGVRVTPQASYASCPDPQVVVVGDVQVAPGGESPAFDPAARWLLQCHAQGALLASACSGAVVLARTGLLDGQEGTSHWAYCDYLQREFPRTRWQAERGLVTGGPGQRILMSGSGVSWHLLVLALVARQQWVALNYASPAPVAQMVALSHLPERTFKRRFAQATGMAPLDYVHHVRLEEAKQLLESGAEPVEAIAVDIGYSDSSFFSRLFKRKVGLGPVQYRQRFGRLARELQGMAGQA